MEHVVFYTGQDGSERYRRAAGLEDAVRHVEHLSNAEGVSDCRVYALSEVPLKVKTVYVVEVSEPAAQTAPAPAAPPAPAAEAAPEPAPEPAPQPAPEPVAAVADPMAELTVPAMPELPEFAPMPVASAPEQPEQPAAPAAPEPSPEPEVVFAALEPPASNGNGNSSTPPRSLGFFAR